MTTEAINPQQETLGFQTAVKQLLHLVTHALYSNKEIFLRELISNASDAADKLRFEGLTDSALYENDPDLKIWLDFDEKARTITIRDNGIGMSREEAIANLGTIAKSGTKEFLENLTGDKAKDAHLIGQFGVGFYSSFVVADRVIVKTRRAGMNKDQGVWWESAGEGDYIIKNIQKSDRGTEIILHLKKDEDEFLNEWRLENIVKKYSDHIMLPIVMQKKIEIPSDKDAKDQTPKTEIKEEVVNRATALWTLPKKDIKDEEYKELYKHITHDFEEPFLWVHNIVEGKLEYITLLFIPTHAPFDLWNYEHRHGLKLYVQRVFIMDDAEQLLPNYLRFVRGIVDSKDLPLNVSREILQNNKVIEAIRGSVVKRILDTLEKLAKDDKEKYAKFWQNFGRVMKEGVAEDFANKESIAKLLRFASTLADNEAQNVSFDDYIARMKPSQEKIYYITADTFMAAKNSPHLEIFRKKGIEVLLLTDRVDEWMVSHLFEYAGKKLQSVAKGEIDIDKVAPDENVAKTDDKEQQEKKEKIKTDFANVIQEMQKVLGDKVKEVKTSNRLTDSPACLVAGEFDMSIHLQRMMQAAGQTIPKGKPILEINPEHPILERLKAETDDQRFAEWTNILFDQAFLAEGGQLEDPATFVKRLNALLLQLAK